MKKISKILAIVLSVIMFISLVPVSSSAAISGKCGDDLTWAYNTSTHTLTISGTGVMKNYSNSYYNDRPWDSYKNNIKTVVINDGVTTIGIEAFAYCDSITSITIGNSVTKIGENAFYSCDSLTSITVDNNNMYFSSDEYGVLFNQDKTMLIQYPNGNTRTSYIIPDTVTTIAYEAFYGCDSLTSLTIPDSVTAFGIEAFYCSNLTDIYYFGTFAEWLQISVAEIDVRMLGNTTIHCEDRDITGIHGYCGQNLLWEIDEATSTLTISGVGPMGIYYDYMHTNPYTYYPWEGYKQSIKHVIINEGVTSIGAYAFWGFGNIESVILPDSLTTMENSVFRECSSLKSIVIPDGIESLYNDVFHSCKSLESVTVSENLKYIGPMAFYGCNNLHDVYYYGLPSQWNEIEVKSHNQNLTSANIHYHYGQEHIFGEIVIDKLPTCETDGVSHGYCDNCDYYVVNAIPKTGHNIVAVDAAAPTCTEKGHTEGEYCTNCDYTKGNVAIPAIGHVDANVNAYCDNCDELLCDHNCHKGGISGFFWMITNFFNRIFGSNKLCKCGVAHY